EIGGRQAGYDAALAGPSGHHGAQELGRHRSGGAGRKPMSRGRESTMAPPAAKWIEVEGGVVRNELLPGKRHHYAVIELPASFPDPAPGQFAMLGPSPSPPGLLLKRPMSVARAWREKGLLHLGFLYTVVGSGTQALARARERWTVIGPLGRGFAER